MSNHNQDSEAREKEICYFMLQSSYINKMSTMFHEMLVN